MQRLERKVREYLDSQNWKYDFEQDKHRFIFGMSLDCADVDSCLMVVRIRDHEDISCRALYRFDVPADKRTAVSEYITRANYGLFMGGFQMDLSDGEVSFCSAGVFTDSAPDIREIRRMIQVTIHMAERYGQGFYDIMNRGVSPLTAIETAESEEGAATRSSSSTSSASSSTAASTAAADTSVVTREEVEGFASLVKEMTDAQLVALLTAGCEEQEARQERRRREEEERRRREEEERRRREEEGRRRRESAASTQSTSLIDKLRGLISGNN